MCLQGPPAGLPQGFLSPGLCAVLHHTPSLGVYPPTALILGRGMLSDASDHACPTIHKADAAGGTKP